MILRPDTNRPGLESVTSMKLADGVIENSKLNVGHNAWHNGGIPKVMLLVPPYTRICKPLDVIIESLHRDNRDLNKYEKIFTL